MNRISFNQRNPSGAAGRRILSRQTSATLVGLGIALAPAALVATDLAAGRLVRLANEEWKGDFAYYLVHPADKAELPTLQRFKSWLRAAL